MFYPFEIFVIKVAEKHNKEIRHNFYHNFKNINCCVMSEVSLKRCCVSLYFDDGLTF